jgi:crossover junction endodeoxyribonuclease RuvC
MGIDPGLRFNGWGVVDWSSGRLRHIANGTVRIPEKPPLSERLRLVYEGLYEVLGKYAPAEVAVEETFVNVNPRTTLSLGQARGVALLASAMRGIPVFEYSPNLVKKSVVGAGHAGKEQIGIMVGILLGRPSVDSEHAADALAMAICRAHSRGVPAP